MAAQIGGGGVQYEYSQNFRTIREKKYSKTWKPRELLIVIRDRIFTMNWLKNQIRILNSLDIVLVNTVSGL